MVIIAPLRYLFTDPSNACLVHPQFFYGIIWEFSPNVTVVGVTVKQKWSKTNSDPEYIQRIRIWEILINVWGDQCWTSRGGRRPLSYSVTPVWVGLLWELASLLFLHCSIVRLVTEHASLAALLICCWYIIIILASIPNSALWTTFNPLALNCIVLLIGQPGTSELHSLHCIVSAAWQWLRSILLQRIALFSWLGRLGLLDCDEGSGGGPQPLPSSTKWPGEHLKEIHQNNLRK